jgi:hypothetical protein
MPQRRGPDGAAAGLVQPGAPGRERDAETTREVPRVHQSPVAEHRESADAPARPGHHDQVVAGEQLGTAHDDQDEPDAEDHPGQHACRAPGRCTGARQRHGREDGAEGDEGARQHRERHEPAAIHRDLGGADLLGAPGHLGRQERVKGHRCLSAVPPGSLARRRAGRARGRTRPSRSLPG